MPIARDIDGPQASGETGPDSAPVPEESQP